MKAWARWYFDQAGWAVFPVHSVAGDVCSCKAGADCSDPTKHPRVTGWQDKRTGLDVDLWWDKWPDALIGIHCNQLLVVDLDGEEGVKAFKAHREKHPPLPLTPTVKTPGGGFHLYFKPLEGAQNKVRILPGVDIRADRGFVIAPPSVGIKGAYEWVKGREPWEVPIADAPPWLAKLVVPLQNKKTGSGGSWGPREPWVANVDEVPMIQSGSRNGMLAHHCGVLYRAYSGAGTKSYAEVVDKVTDKLLEINKKKCVPPLRDREVRAIENSLRRLG